ncbi:MAG TPA: hypothetical protein VFS72_11505 [Agromyces sp.]|nr:hypothetical protein [Agromyces sp.]
MTAKPPPGTFKLFPYAKPPLPAGRYTVTGRIDDLPGAVEELRSAVDVTAPRFHLPPDQVLSTFPPASSRGAFATRLPQVVLRRRTIPWERSAPVGAGRTPEPWLALVLIAESEGNLRSDVPVEDAVTDFGRLPDPTDRDVPKTTSLEVPRSVVRKVFPAREDLPFLCHVRLVDLADTELALGDDDGWMAVVLCNRLPQAGTKYTACLVNLEGQLDALPTDPPVADGFRPGELAFDVNRIATAVRGVSFSADAAGMGLGGHVGEGVSAPRVIPAATSSSAGASWTGSAKLGAASAAAESTAQEALAAQASRAGASGISGISGIAAEYRVALPFHLVEPTLRFPVLAHWSFVCEGDDDFQRLADAVSSRLLGHVATEPELPDGGPAPAVRGDVEAPSNRPLPLVLPTGHVATAHETRVGGRGTAWFRGPLIPEPAERAGAREDGRLPLAHHADQLRRVTPDGLEDLTYAAAFEIGRLLALSRPSVVAALNRWRRERFAAATTASVAEEVVGALPGHLRGLLTRPDPVLDARRITSGEPFPGPGRPDELGAAGTGRRFARGILSVLGEDPGDVAARVAEPAGGFAAADPAVFATGRADRIAAGLGLDGLGLEGLDVATPDAAAKLWGVAAPLIERDPQRDRASARADLEDLAGALAEAAARLEKGR